MAEPVLVLLHVGNWDVYEKMRAYLANLVGVTRRLVVTLVPSCAARRAALEEEHAGSDALSVDVLLVPNIGMDVGGFLMGYQWARERYAPDCATVLKLHTKSDDKWRDELMRPLLGSRACVQRMLRAMALPTSGMYCARRWHMLHSGLYEYPLNTPLIDQWMAALGMRRHPDRERFVAGTVFLYRTAILEALFAPGGATLQEVIDAMPPGRVSDRHEGQLPHAMERVLGYAVAAHGYTYLDEGSSV